MVKWNKISEFQEPENSPGFLLWLVSTKWRRNIESVLASLDLTHGQFVILANVNWLGKATQVELARHCKTDISMTSQILRTLEKRGLIERVMRDGDERAKVPRITKKGAKLIEKAIPLVESADRKFFGKLGKDAANLFQKLI